VSGVPAIIGAFFLGMVFAETKFADRLELKLSSFRDAFVAIFFVLFGMLIDPAMFPSIILIVVAAVPLVIISDLLVTGALAYLLGFSGRAATSMGASMCGRGAESVMYASVGSNAVNATKGSELYPFAGLFCFIMSVITPVMMKFSDKIYRGLSKLQPSYMKHSGAVISRTLGKIVLPTSLRLFKRGRRIEIGLVTFFCLLIAIVATDGIYHIAFAIAATAICVWIFRVINRELRPITRIVNYENLGVFSRDGTQIARFIALFIFGSLLAILLVAFVFTYLWWFSAAVLLGYLIAMLALAKSYSRRFRSPVPLTGESAARSVWEFQSPPPAKARGDMPVKKPKVGLLSRRVKPTNGNGNGKGKKPY
jgi:CPA2 family monovalent cation:H+ antiporter-2